MIETPLLSVIIPTRRRRRQLLACLSSLAGQDYPRDCWEAIVVFDGEDCCPDGQLSALSRLMPVTFATQPHSGCGIARNRGAVLARGRFLIFTDDDCSFPPDWLSRYAEVFALDPETLAAGRSVNALRGNPWSQATQEIVEFLQVRSAARMAIGNNFGLPAEGFRNCGGFDERFYRAAAEDRDFSARWLAAGRHIVDAPGIVVHHAHELNLRSFLRQHYRYGQGAYLLQSRLASTGRESGRQPIGFYLSLVFWPFWQHRGCRRSRRFWPMILLSQCAQAAGYTRRWLWKGSHGA